jgi:hypothetical protein
LQTDKHTSKASRPAPKRRNFIPRTPKYFSYNWAADKDPDLYLITGLIGESGMSPEDIEHATEALGYRVSRHCVIGWLYGTVRRPQNWTLTIVALALGYTKTWTPTPAPASKVKPREESKSFEQAVHA